MYINYLAIIFSAGVANYYCVDLVLYLVSFALFSIFGFPYYRDE